MSNEKHHGWCNKAIAGGGECSLRAGHDGTCK